MQLYSRVIKEVEESESGSHIGAFFDFDGTVIYGYSAIKFLREQIRRGDVKFAQLPELVSIMGRFSLGSTDFSAMMTETSSYLKGIKEEDYIEFGEELYKKHLAKLIYPETRALIEAHIRKGHTVGLVSAATPYQVVPAARDLGMPHVMCTHLEVEDGKFTGEVVHPTCYGMGKVEAAKKIIEADDVDIDKSFFYSDSHEDIQLLEYVGKPRPLNPNSRLRSIAKGRGWPVQDFHSRGKNSLKDYARTIALQGSLVGAALASLPIYGVTRSVRKSRNFSVSLFADLATAISGMELAVTGEEHVWSQRPCIFVFNHQSQVDVLVLAALLRRDLAGVGKKEIGKMPVIGKIFEFAGTVLIDRENTNTALQAMKPLVETIQKEGRSVCIAPEGTRSTSTALGRFKKGAFHLAIQAEVPIVPIVIHNALDMAPRGQFVVKPATIKVDVLEPIDTSHWSSKTIDEHVEQVRDLFLLKLDQMDYQQQSLPAKSPGASAVDVKRARREAQTNKSRPGATKVSAQKNKPKKQSARTVSTQADVNVKKDKTLH